MATGRPPGRVLTGRALLALGLGAFPFLLAELNKWHPAHGTVKFLTGYSPEHFAHGAVWTLPFSALITAKVSHVSVAIFVMVVLMAPYLILSGPARTAVRFFAGHVGCTLVAFVALVATSAAGWATATRLYRASDTGISAGLAAIGGAFVVLLWRTRARWLAVPAALLPLYFYSYRMSYEPPPRLMADLEHLLAFSTGALVEWHWPRRAWPERECAVVGTGVPGTMDP